MHRMIGDNGISYIVTEYARWSDPDKRHFNVSKGTVCGMYADREAAVARINELLKCNLYGGFDGKWIGDDMAEIKVPGYLHAKFNIYEHDFRKDDKQ